MRGIYIKVIPKKGYSYENFFNKLHEINIFENFEIYQIAAPVYEFREEFLHHIIEHGFTSLFKFTIVMEDITSPSMSVDEVKEVIIKFINKLKGAKTLIIIDPYFYAPSRNNNLLMLKLFKDLISQLTDGLEKLFFITNGKYDNNKNEIHKIVKELNPNIEICDIVTDKFHDRYWIDSDNKRGIVMGTSLNGLGNKVALIDSLEYEDIEEILKLAKEEGLPI